MATAELSPWDNAAPICAIINKNPGIKMLFGEVENINPKIKSLWIRNCQSISFGQMLISIGAQNRITSDIMNGYNTSEITV